MPTCDPVMVLSEDITIIDKLAQQQTKADLSRRENRKELLSLRKQVLHELIEKGLPFFEQR